MVAKACFKDLFATAMMAIFLYTYTYYAFAKAYFLQSTLRLLGAAHNSKIQCIFSPNRQDDKLKQTSNPDSYRELHSIYVVPVWYNL